MSIAYDDIKDFCDYIDPDKSEENHDTGLDCVLVDDAPEYAQEAFEKFMMAKKEERRRGWKV